MEIRYNVTGERRKALVKVISDTTGARAVYKFMPTCNYEIDYFTVTKDGTLLFDDRSDSEEVEKVLEAIAAAGFDCEPADTEANSPKEAEQDAPSAEPEEPAQEAGEAATEGNSAEEGEQAGLTISLPMDGFNPDSLGRLQKLVDSKATLIRKAMGAQCLTVRMRNDKVEFPWWDALPEAEEVSAYTAFIAALGRMAKESKRVTATEKDVESEKYAFRGFLLRLGFIGADSKEQRKLLLKNLSGSAAFPNREKADAFSAAQKAKRDAAKASEVTA